MQFTYLCVNTHNMAEHHKTGKWGEQVAARFLTEKGYEVLHTNWQQGKCEVDIIAKQNNLLIFAEVKTRSTNYFGYPEQRVNKNKQKMLVKAAGLYTEINELDLGVRFDVISITIQKGSTPQIYHIEDAFTLYHNL